MSAATLTLYYDGHCAICTREVARLAGWDGAGKLAFVDIAQAGFDPADAGASMAELNREMHSRTAQGELLVGVDSMLAAYRLVGRGARVWPLRVPLLRGVLAWAYRLFARHRYAISRLLGLTAPACADGVCGIGHPFLRGHGTS
jgi:predicted DCC family thiol-disulfide oxidoreductase YuxK